MNSPYFTKFSVDELIQTINILLLKDVGLIKVIGEVNNPNLASSGHWYFNLLGNNSSIRCTLFRNYANLSGLTPIEGNLIEVEAEVNIYPPRGEIQLLVKKIKPSGKGAQFLAFEQLKKRLNAEGLFNQDQKKIIPKYPKTIGIITSFNTAALQDVIKVISERSSHIKVWVYHSSVQGINAPREIISALNLAEFHKFAEIMLIVRGGGSPEDLGCFNDETLIRRLAEFTIPTISGIGHETDFTLTDLVCDLRSPTPTAAANCLPSTDELNQLIINQKTKLNNLFNRKINNLEQHIDYTSRAFNNFLKTHIFNLNINLQNKQAKIFQSLIYFIEALNRNIEINNKRLKTAYIEYITKNKQKTQYYSKVMKTYDPSQLQKKGYVLITNAHGTIVKSVGNLKTEEKISSHFFDGIVDSVVNKINKL